MVRTLLIAAVSGLAFGAACAVAVAQPVSTAPAFITSGDPAFDAWRDAFAARAIAAGRDPRVVRRLLDGLAPEARIVSADRNQAEFVRPVWDYIVRGVSPTRVETGARLRGENAALFAAIEARFGVDADVIAGIWGVETNFGQVALPHEAPRALATLAAEGRRRAQFETYLLALIEMVERGYAGPAELRSSWAGALGQPQFMPDVYLKDAVDWDNDGRRDIWTNRGDVLASIANYLAVRGWRAGQPVFDEARLPAGFDYALADGTSRPVEAWRALGVTLAGGGAFAPETTGLAAQLFLPAGAEGPALLLYPNFAVIRSYNPSDRYALVVALLARAFEGRAGLQQPWPTHLGALQRDDMLDLQRRLNAAGHLVGAEDGMFGSGTRRGVRSYQQSVGLPADGFPTYALLTRLRGVPASATSPAAPPAAPIAPPADVRADARPLDKAGVRTLQRHLARLGHPIGKPTGTVGPKTRRAIEALERSLGLSPTGRASTWTLQAAARAVRAR